MRRTAALRACCFLLLAFFLLAGCERTADDIRVPDGSKRSLRTATPEIARKGGEWVVITAGYGQYGDVAASSWYLVRFYDDGTVRIRWATPARYARERANYTQKGNIVTITGAFQAPQVNGIQFVVGPDDSLTATIPGQGGGDVPLTFTHRNPDWPYLHWILLCIGLAAVAFAWRRWFWFTPLVMGAGVVLLAIYWVNTLETMPPLRWVKNYTLVATVWIFWLARHTSLTKYVWMRLLCAGVIGLNILDACRVDFMTGYIPNLLNCAAGLLGLLAMTRWMGIGPNRKPTNDLVWPGQPYLWIIAYDIWNITYSYLNFNEFTSHSIALNFIATLLTLWIAGTWAATRGVTLGFFYLYLFTFGTFAMEKSFVPVPINNTSAYAAAILSFTVNFIVCAMVWRWKRLKKAPAWPNVGQYRHADHRMVGHDDSINVDLDKIPALADYPPCHRPESSEKPATPVT